MNPLNEEGRSSSSSSAPQDQQTLIQSNPSVAATDAGWDRSTEFWQVLAALEKRGGVKKQGRNWRAHCPAHDDHSPSLDVAEGREGRALVTCRSRACTYEQVKAALGLEVGASRNDGADREPEAVYQYVDEQAELLFEVVRFPGKQFRQRRPDGSWGTDGVRRVLYRLPEVHEAIEAGRVIYLVEGEKDAEAIFAAGAIATCNPMGAGKWRDEYTGMLAGAAVVIVADRDQAGRAHAAAVRDAVSSVARSVVVVEPAAGKDAYDHLAAGLTLGQLVPWQSDTQRLLDDVRTFIRRFVVLSEEQATAVSHWVLHTYVYDALGITPYMSITSAEKQSGKTVLLEVLALLVRDPWLTGSTSPAVLARKVDAQAPTLLLDESDAAFKGDKEYAEALRGVLNTGFKASGKYSRCENQGAGVRDFSTFCPKAIAGIGRLPDTIADRSIPIRLKRKAASEKVERKRERKITAEADPLRQRLVAWAAAHDQTLRELDADAFEDFFQHLSARAADIWEPLLAIAFLAGDQALTRAKTAALRVSGTAEAGEPSLGERLLADIRDIFREQDTDRLTSSQLVAGLNALEESPWAEFKAGKPLTTNGLASMLKRYELRPRTIRPPDGSPLKGYLLEHFQDAFTRYLSATGESAVTPSQTAVHAGSEPSEAVKAHPAEDEPSQPQPGSEADCNGVTATQAGQAPTPLTSDPTPPPADEWETLLADGRDGFQQWAGTET
jgi:hypothetical protein